MRFSIRYFIALCLLMISLRSGSDLAGAEGPNPERQKIRVAIYNDVGVGKSILELINVIEQSPNIRHDLIKLEDIRADKLSGYDVLIHPGGSGGKQGRHLGKDGRTKVRSFVKEGGGFIGICAGAYLASSDKDYEWSLRILDAKVIDKKHWARGHGNVKLDLSSSGKSILGTQTDSLTIMYWQGPLLAPADDPVIPDYQGLATFQTEIAEKGAPKNVMKGTTAVASGKFGQGRVLCFSPHPEKTKETNHLVHRAVRWAARKR